MRESIFTPATTLNKSSFHNRTSNFGGMQTEEIEPRHSIPFELSRGERKFIWWSPLLMVRGKRLSALRKTKRVLKFHSALIAKSFFIITAKHSRLNGSAF